MFRLRFIVLFLITVGIFVIVLISRSKEKEGTVKSLNEKLAKGSSDSNKSKALPKIRDKNLSDAVPSIQLTKGKVLVYSLTGDIDLKFSILEKPVRKAEHYDISFTLKVIDKLDEAYLLGIGIQSYKTEVTAEGEKGPSSYSYDFKDFLQKPFCRPGFIILVVSKRGIVQEVLVDNRFNDNEWVLDGFQHYVGGVLGLIKLFPPLPPANNFLEDYTAEIDYCGWIGFEYIVRAEKIDGAKYLIKWRPRRMTHFLGMKPTEQRTLDDKDLKESSGLYTKEIGFYENIRHNFYGEKDNTHGRVDLSIKLVNSYDEPTAESFAISLDRMARFKSIDELQKLVAGLMQKGAKLREFPADKSKLIHLLHEIDSLELQIEALQSQMDKESEQDYERRHELLEKQMLLASEARKMITFNPKLLKDLEDFVKSNPLSENMLLEIMHILSSPKVRDLPGADDLALFILKNNPDSEIIHFNADIGVFQSDNVLDYLLSSRPENDIARQSRDSDLAHILKGTIEQRDFEKGRRILDKFYLELQSQQGIQFSTLYLPFEIDNDFVNQYIEEKWKNEFDKKTPLKIMVFRAYTDSQKSQEFREIVEGNLFHYFNQEEISNLINIISFDPRISKKKDFLKFIANSATNDQLRQEAELSLIALEHQEKALQEQDKK